MDQNEIIRLIERIRPQLEAEGVLHLALFGSRSRGDHRSDSDLDILIDIAPDNRFSLLNLVGVEHLVGDATGLVSNAIVRRSLDKALEKSIRRDVLEVF